MLNLFEDISDNPLNLLPNDGTVHYYGKVFSQEKSDFYYDYLFNQIPWENDEAVIFGKLILTKRKVAWFGEKPFEYTYSKRTKYAKFWTPELLELKQNLFVCQRKKRCPKKSSMGKTGGKYRKNN